MLPAKKSSRFGRNTKGTIIPIFQSYIYSRRKISLALMKPVTFLTNFVFTHYCPVHHFSTPPCSFTRRNIFVHLSGCRDVYQKCIRHVRTFSGCFRATVAQVFAPYSKLRSHVARARSSRESYISLAIRGGRYVA